MRAGLALLEIFSIFASIKRYLIPMNRHLLLPILLLITTASILHCQVATKDSTRSLDTLDVISPALGVIDMTFPEGMLGLIESYKKENYKAQGSEGYRIQLFSDGGTAAKEEAQKLVESLNEQYPDQSAYLTYDQPNFKVRCGDFRTKAEARKAQIELLRNYPGCFIVKDNIRIPD